MRDLKLLVNGYVEFVVGIMFPVILLVGGSMVPGKGMVAVLTAPSTHPSNKCQVWELIWLINHRGT